MGKFETETTTSATKMSDAPSVAWCVSAHGFGHAARAAALMDALWRRLPGARIHVFTSVPEWFFAGFASHDPVLHSMETDVGMVQQSPMRADVPATIDRLDRFFSDAERRVAELADGFRASGCCMVVCDIAPLGLAAAQAAGIPSVLVENFTWDWIYGAYLAEFPSFKRHIDALAEMFGRADWHIQTAPICRPIPSSDLSVGLMPRPLRNPVGIRRKLGVPDTDAMVVLTLGGVPAGERLQRFGRLPEDCWLVIPGAANRLTVEARVIRLPSQTGLYHPDLIAASDAVVGKAGYSTLAEVVQAGVPYGYVLRPDFPEMAAMERFIRDHLPAVRIDEHGLASGEWIRTLPELLAMPRREPQTLPGADRAAAFLVEILNRSGEEACRRSRK